MDTRGKIVTPAEALEVIARAKDRGASATVVTGYFDPLLASHARRLEEIATRGRPLVVMVTSPPDPLLAARARAELVAALSVVDAVAIAEGGVPDLAGVEVIHEEQTDRERTRELIQLVKSKS